MVASSPACGILESVARFKMAGAPGINLAGNAGTLIPVNSSDAMNTLSIALLARWREQAADAYLVKFPVTLEGTRTWLERGVLGTADRVLFWVVDPKGRKVGHLGLFRYDPATHSIELDNVVRGEADGPAGIMMRATEALCRWCLEQEEISHVYLRVFSDNQRALKLYSRAGFVELFRKPLVKIETSNGWKWEEAPELHRAPVTRHFVTMRLGRDRVAPPVISVVVPARNEEGNLPRAYSEITRVLEALAEPYEVLLIDNASSDKTQALAEEICQSDNRWRYLRFSRDFGVETSMLAGLRAARGDATVILFSDLQDPPELIATLMARWREGHDVVYGVVNQRGGEPWWKCLGARLFYRVMSAAGETPLPPDATDFRLLSRRAREAVASCGERNRYFRGLSHWVGFPSCAMPYDRRPRLAGTSKAPPFYMMALAARALTAFSLAPVHMLGLGLLACGSIALATTAIWIIGLISGNMLFDMTASMVLQWWTLAAVMMAGWTCGEYAGRTYRESRARPEYLVESSIRWDNQQSSTMKETVPTGQQSNRFTGYHTPTSSTSDAPTQPTRTTTLPGRQRPAWAPVSRP